MSMIMVEHLTRDYGLNRGVFDVSFSVEKGEVFGFLGPNGSGKTTTIRYLMGFGIPDNGKTYIDNKDCFKHRHEIMRDVGFLPGEVPLPEGLTGWEFIRLQQQMKNVRDDTQLNRLLDIFELDPKGSTKRMSLGMRRKLAIVVAFMHDPGIMILDEPSNGLDPVMQDRFITYINEEKQRGKTVLLSSHMFSEVDATCDRVSIIRAGSIVASVRMNDVRHGTDKVFEITFTLPEELSAFENGPNIVITEMDKTKRRVIVHVPNSGINNLIDCLSQYDIESLSENKMTLESYFLQFYNQAE